MRYAQIDGNGICFADSYLFGEVNANDMIPLDENVMFLFKNFDRLYELNDCISIQFCNI